MGLSKLIKNYRELGHKEFMAKWKEGTSQATALQQTRAQLTFTRITMVGIALGFCASIYAAKNLWWLAIILGAALGNTYIGYIGLKQKEKLLITLEDNYKEVQ